MGFIDLEKAYDRINMEVLLQVLGMYDGWCNLLRKLKVCMLIV